jgi:hypothetical protein
MVFPQMFRVRQRFDRPRVADVLHEVHEQLRRLDLGRQVRAGQTVAITAGSRGIANIDGIIKAAVDHFKQLGAKPFIVAAMGSHGGGTPEGQRHILASYGITEEACGCPVQCDMATVVLDHTEEGVPVHFARDAAQADHVLVVGRIKPHTRLVGEFQSGLMKMMLIGLGKHEGARVYHRAFEDYSFEQIVRSVARRVIAKGRVVAGLAIVENAYDETGLIRGLAPLEFETKEKELLTLSQQWLPRLPFDRVDILLIDEIGKEISGSGLDTNVVGRKAHEHHAGPEEFPKIKRIVVRGLSQKTNGNATGLGLTEFCVSRVIKAMDTRTTWVNVLTAGNPAAGMVPPHFETDREVLEAALGTVGLVEPPEAKVLWIRNTLDLAEVECSEAWLTAAQKRADLEIISGLRALPWDAWGDLPLSMHHIDTR